MGQRGPKPGQRFGGREKGTKNKKTLARESLTEAAINAGISPLQFMLDMMRAKVPKCSPAIRASLLTLRFEAAKAAAPYVHPKPSPVTAPRDSVEAYARKIREAVGDIDRSVLGPAPAAPEEKKK